MLHYPDSVNGVHEIIDLVTLALSNRCVIRNDSGEAVASGVDRIVAVADAMQAEAIVSTSTSLCLRPVDEFLGT
jgi:hypothetical protein